MLSKLLPIVVGVVAYVLGAKAGRERYEQITGQVMRLWRDPQVREKAAEAADVVKDKAPEAKTGSPKGPDTPLRRPPRATMIKTPPVRGRPGYEPLI